MEREPSSDAVADAGDRATTARLRLFVVHAPEDAWFVDGFLLRAVPLHDSEVLVSSNLQPGAVIVREIERGALSPMTVVVVSPAFLHSPWAQFAHQLAMTQSIETASDDSATLIPALLADCELPLLSRFLAPLDFRNQERASWEAEVAKLRDRLAAPAPVLTPLPCPYPGIRPFTTEDAARFHGRNSEVSNLLRSLRDGKRELYVIGPSGSGKSSLVAAGLVSSLHRSPDLAGGCFLIRWMRPGNDPAAALAGALDGPDAELRDAELRWLGDSVSRLIAGHPGHDRLLIVVDQLEELFTGAKPKAREAFIAAVGVLRCNLRVVLIFTLRADFYASLMESALWNDLGGQLSRLDVNRLRGDRLRIAIEAPARALGVYFEPVLIERLLHDVADEPGALPLLQDTLLDLWHRRTHDVLLLAEYEAMRDGDRTGLAVTVARRADEALSELSPARRAIARRVLLRLIQFGEGVTTTRRQQPRSALATAGDAPEEIDTVIRHLADRRLVTTSGGDDTDRSTRVDLAHEVLLSAWPALGNWMHTRKDDEQRRRVLEAKAAEWVKAGRGQSRLLDADELREVRSWLSDDTARDLGVSADIQDLLARSEAALIAQRAEAEGRRRRWRRWMTIAIAGLTGAVLTVSTLAVIARQRAREVGEQARQLKQQLGRSYVSRGLQELISNHPEQAVPYLVAARQAGLEDVSLRMLFRWAAEGLPRLRFRHRGAVSSVAWSPDGKRVATGSDDQTARIWDAASGQPVTPPLSHRGGVAMVTWSPDGKYIATASEDHSAQVWYAASGQPVTPPLPHQSAVTAVVWSPDGMHVATASDDHTARIWDALRGQQLAPALSHQDAVTAVAWSPDGKQLATASGNTAQVWNAVTGQLMTPPLAHQGDVLAVAWSPDGGRIATASKDGTARVWDSVRGKLVVSPLVHQGDVRTLAWSPDGRRLATASGDRSAQIWDALSAKPVTQPLMHLLRVAAVAWSPDGKLLATASWDQTTRVWDAASGQPVTLPLAHRGLVLAVAWSPDGHRLATASWDQAARIWDVVGGRSLTRPLAHRDSVSALAWSPDGTRVATASFDRTVQIWDAVVGRPLGPPLVHRSAVAAVAWSPDGARVATASTDWTARIWDVATGRLATLPIVHQNPVKAVAWSPDGTRVATASGTTARVWNVADGQAITPPLTHDGTIHAIAWSPDGTKVATASGDQTARVWDAANGHPVTLPLRHQASVVTVAWSPDGAKVATASDDFTAQIWDATSGRPVAPRLMHEREVRVVAWKQDGQRVATASLDQTARVWDAVTGRPLTPPLAHDGPIWTMDWSPDGTRIATAGEDRAAKVWDAVTGQPVTRPFMHDGPIWALRWNPDGKRLATASVDRTARVWDVSWDAGTLADWAGSVDRGDYRLNDDGILVVRDPETLAAPLPSFRTSSHHD